MNGKFLVDSNLWIGLLRNDTQARDRIDSLPNIYICPHILGELFAGAYNSLRPLENCTKIANLMAIGTLLSTDSTVAHEYGVLREQLRRQGTPIPENDLWIAATALVHQLTVVTHDKHFDFIPHLPKDRW